MERISNAIQQKSAAEAADQATNQLIDWRTALTEDINLQLLRLLEEDPEISQRNLAHAAGISLGKVNYCLKALVEKGWVKTQNFRRSNNKLAYAYILTPAGIKRKAEITVKFLQRKQREYKELEREINRLRKEVEEMRAAHDDQATR